MGRNYFTDEQIDEFKKNKYIKSITKANITFTKEFKQKFYGLLLDGIEPSHALSQLGINYRTLGKRRVDQLAHRIRIQAQREEGFDRKKGKHVGRPKKLTFDSPEEEIKYLKDQLEYQKQEIEFLKKLEALEKKYQ